MEKIKINNKYFEILYPDISSEQKKQKKKNLKKRLLSNEFNLYKEYYLAINFYLTKYKNADYSLFRNYKYDKKYCKIKYFIKNIYQKNDLLYDEDEDSDDEDEEGDEFFRKKITDMAGLFRCELNKMEKGLKYRNKDSCHQIKFLNFCYFINNNSRKYKFIKDCCQC